MLRTGFQSSAERFGLDPNDPPPDLSAFVTEGDIVEIAGLRLRAIEMPGHTPGSVSYYAEEGALFRSPNGGVTWARVMLEGTSGSPSDSDRGGGGDDWPRIPCVTRLWDTEDTTFASAGDTVWASHDTGRNWMPLATGLPPANAIAASF